MNLERAIAIAAEAHIGPDGRLRPETQFKPRNPLEDAIENPVQKEW